MESQQTASDPWINAEARYLPGQAVTGTVTRITHFGVFVQLEPQLEGVIYTFELGSQLSSIAGYTPDMQLQLYVKSIDSHRRRLELSLQNTELPGLLTERDLLDEVRQRKIPPDLSFSSGKPLFELPERTLEKQFCPTCQEHIQAAWKYCIYCGGSLQNRCPICGAAQPVLPGARYCCECGSKQ